MGKVAVMWDKGVRADRISTDTYGQREPAHVLHCIAAPPTSLTVVLSSALPRMLPVVLPP